MFGLILLLFNIGEASASFLVELKVVTCPPELLPLHPVTSKRAASGAVSSHSKRNKRSKHISSTPFPSAGDVTLWAPREVKILSWSQK